MNVRQMLQALGTPSYLIDLAIPFVWIPVVTMPLQAQSTIEIVRALQRGLRKIGYTAVRENGMLDAATRSALNEVSPAWKQKTFVQVIGDVLDAMRNPERKARDIAMGLADYFDYQGVPPGPLPSFRAGTPPGPLGLGSTSIDNGVALEFGQGISNKTNIVPIPKTSGITYAAFKNLQRQINRALAGTGSRTDEDGIIGAGTLKAFKKAASIVEATIPVFSLTVAGQNTVTLAQSAVTAAASLKTYADRMGVSASANKGSTSTPASKAEPTPPPLTQEQANKYADNRISGAVSKYVPFLFLAAGVAWYAASQKKGKKK
jgi:hypothetical protein